MEAKVRAARAAALFLTLVFLLFICKCEEDRANRRYDGIALKNRVETASALRQGLKERSPCITVTLRSYSDNPGDMGKMAAELMEEALSESEDGTEGDYIRYQYGGYSTLYSRKRNGNRWVHTLRFLPEYYTTLEEEEEVNCKVAEILSKLNLKEPKLEIIRALYRYVMENVSYDRVHLKNTNQHKKTTAYAALVQKSAVCQGYASAMYRLLKEAGINARIITGYAINPESKESEFHSWNLVCLDGLWYHLDATWGRTVDPDRYFMKGEEDFPDHIVGDEFKEFSFLKEYPIGKKGITK